MFLEWYSIRMPISFRPNSTPLTLTTFPSKIFPSRHKQLPSTSSITMLPPKRPLRLSKRDFFNFTIDFISLLLSYYCLKFYYLKYLEKYIKKLCQKLFKAKFLELNRKSRGKRVLDLSKWFFQVRFQCSFRSAILEEQSKLVLLYAILLIVLKLENHFNLLIIL